MKCFRMLFCVCMMVGTPSFAASSLPISIFPRPARLGETVTMTITNTLNVTLEYNDCCAGPKLNDLNGELAFMTECLRCIDMRKLAPGETFTYSWRLDETGTALSPGIYNVVWDRFKDAGNTTYQGTSALEVAYPVSRTLLLKVSGEGEELHPEGPLTISATNTTDVPLTYNHCCLVPRFVGPYQRTGLCGDCANCVDERVLAPGETCSVRWDSTQLAKPLEMGPYWFLWDDFRDEKGRRYGGSVRVLLTPKADAALRVAVEPDMLFSTDDRASLTLFNPLDVLVSYNTCCAPPYIFDKFCRQTYFPICMECLFEGFFLPQETMSRTWQPSRDLWTVDTVPGPFTVVWPLQWADKGRYTGVSELELVEPVMLPLFRRGDVNGDDRWNLADAIGCLSYLYNGEQDVDCPDAYDMNDDGALNLADPITLLSHLFSDGLALPSPGLVCGMDLTDDPLDCPAYPCR